MSSNSDTDTDTPSVGEFEPDRGSVPQELDIADDSHPVKEAMGAKAHREFEAHEATLGEAYAFRYEKAREGIREYIANAETACIRACRHQLHQLDGDTYDDSWFESHTVRELIDEAERVLGYRPVIETHESPSGASMPRFVIEDNGIGIAVEEFVAVRTLGLSGNHAFGDQLGDFGQGIMSGFNLVGEHGTIEWYTWSRQDDANYGERMRIDGMNDLPGKRESYGTTFKFPTFSDEAEPVDVTDAIEAYTQALRVPVLHHIYDEDGVEQEKEEYTPESLADALLDDEDPRFVYEDSGVEAVMSPAISVDQQECFLVSQPIEPGCDLDSFQAPYRFHIRLKNENGEIYESTHSSNDHSGKIPVTEAQYENKLIEDRQAITVPALTQRDLVGYDVDGHDDILVPTGADDDIVAEMDGVVASDDAPGQPNVVDVDANAVVVNGPNEGYDIVTVDEWQSIPTDIHDNYVTYSEISEATTDDAKVYPVDAGVDFIMPEPVDDRGRLAENDGAFFSLISHKCKQQLIEAGARLFERLDDEGFDAIFEFSDEEMQTLTMAFENYVSEGRDGLSDQVVRIAINESFDVSIDGNLAAKLTVFSNTVEFAPRDTAKPHKRYGRDSRPVSEVVREAGTEGTVYMAANINADKATLAWNIDDNNCVVGVDNASEYKDYSDLLGWTPLKELDLYNVKEKYDIPDDVAADIEQTRNTVDADYDGYSIHELKSKVDNREVKLRTAESGSYSSVTPDEIIAGLEGNERLRDPDGLVNYLLVYNQTEVSGVATGSRMCKGSISRTVVPQYVADYLAGTDNCWIIDGNDHREAVDEIQAQMRATETAVSDISEYIQTVDDSAAIEDNAADTVSISTVTLDDLDTNDYAVLLPQSVRQFLNDDGHDIDRVELHRTVAQSLVEEDLIDGDANRLLFVTDEFLQSNVLVWDSIDFERSEPNLIRHRSVYDCPSSIETERWDPSGSVALNLLFPEERFDRTAPEWNHLVEGNSRSIKRGYDSGNNIVNVLHRLAKFVPEDEPLWPSQVE